MDVLETNLEGIEVRQSVSGASLARARKNVRYRKGKRFNEISQAHVLRIEFFYLKILNFIIILRSIKKLSQTC